MLQKLYNSIWFAPDKGVSVFFQTRRALLTCYGKSQQFIDHIYVLIGSPVSTLTTTWTEYGTT